MASFELYSKNLKLGVEGDSDLPDGSDLYMRALVRLIKDATPDVWLGENAIDTFYAETLQALAQHWKQLHRGRSYKSTKHCLDDMIQHLTNKQHL